MSPAEPLLPVPGDHDERRLRGRALALLWATGTTLFAASILLPDDTSIEEPQLATAAAVAYGFAAAMFLGAGRLPRWTFDLALAAGSALIAVAIHYGDGATSAYVLFFVWQLIFAAYFLPRWRAALQVLTAAAAYSLALLSGHGPGFATSRWALALSTFAVVGLLVGAVRAHVDQLIARLGAAARTDPLTGLAKLVNDRHGHPVGDHALMHLADILRENARSSDLPARLGGEEFAVLLPETTAATAQTVAERIRRQLSDHPTAQGVALTASFGIAQARDGDDPLAAADTAMYQAKAQGRNRTIVASRAVQTADASSDVADRP